MNKEEKNSKHNSRKPEHRRGMSKGQIRAERRQRSKISQNSLVNHQKPKKEEVDTLKKVVKP